MDLPEAAAFSKIWKAGIEAVGQPHVDDYNSDDHRGGSRGQFSIADGKRQSTHQTYLMEAEVRFLLLA